MKRLVPTAILAVLLAGAAFAEGVPGVRGVNHIGITVPDLLQAETFFTDVMGCQKATAFGPFRKLDQPQQQEKKS